MIIDYLPEIGNVQRQSPGAAVVLNVEYQFDGRTIPESDITGESVFVQSIFNTMKTVSGTRATSTHRKFTFHIGEDQRCPLLKIDGLKASLLDDFSSSSVELQAFVNAIKSHDPTDGKGLFVELCELEDLKDEPDGIEMELKSQTSIKLIEGKYTEVTEDVPVQVTDPKPIFKDGVDTGKTIDIPRPKPGKKVSKANKDRLRDLRVIRDAL